MRLQRRLERRHPDAAPDARRPARLVDLVDFVEACEIEADRAVEAAADRRLHAPAHRRAATEGDHRGVRARRVLEYRLDVGLAACVGDEVGRIAAVERELARVVRERLAVGVDQPVALVGRGEDLEFRRHLDARLPRTEGVLGRGLADLELAAEALPEARGDHLVLGLRDVLVLVAPADELEPALGHGIPPDKVGLLRHCARGSAAASPITRLGG
jgi:hypothetical protein